MHIRCERCATLYELDESLLAPEGSPVQCAKCEHVFTASPPRAAPPRRESRPEPQPEPLPESRAEAAAADDVSTAPAPTAVSSGTAGGGRALADWDSAPPVYRGSPPVGLRSPLLRQNPVGAFESRLRWMARARWLVPTAAVALLAAGGGAFWLVRARIQATAERPHGDRAATAHHDGARQPSPAAPAPAAPDAPQPPAGPAGNEEPSPRKAVALQAASAESPAPAPGHPGAGDATSAAADGAPAAAPGAAPPGPSAAAIPRRKRSAGPLAPAALPELAPASAAPEIEPPPLEMAPVEPRTDSSVHEGETVGGG